MSSISESLEESGLSIWTSLFYASIQGRELDLHEQFLEHWFAVSTNSSVCYTLWSWIFFMSLPPAKKHKARALDPWSWSPLLTIEIHGNFRRLSSSESQSRCSNDASERKVFIVEQEIIHATTKCQSEASKARWSGYHHRTFRMIEAVNNSSQPIGPLLFMWQDRENGIIHR